MNRNGIRLSFAVMALAAVVASFAESPAAASPRWSDWSAPVWLGATVNSSAQDFGPAVSKDGLALYISSTRANGLGGADIWVSYRPTSNSPWGTPTNLGAPINSAGNDSVPAFSRDGHWMFFSRAPVGQLPDIWASYRLHTHEDFGPFGWQDPQPLSSINSAFNDVAPAYFQDDETGTAYLIFASNRPGGAGDFDLYVAVQQSDGSFGDVSNIAELNTAVQDARPTVSHNGLEIVFHSLREGSMLFDLWSATRESTLAPWSTPTNLTSVNSAASEAQPHLSADGLTLYITTNRVGGLGANDLWVSTRTKETGKP